MYIHESLNTEKFANDKKLNLLKANIITIGQFLSLIEFKDPYTVIGPALVAKDSINTFINEWTNSSVMLKTLQRDFLQEVSAESIYENLPIFIKIFPELQDLGNQYINAVRSATCTTCKKNRYAIKFVSAMKKYYNDGRDLGDQHDFIYAIMKKYFNESSKLTLMNSNDFDIDWINPDSLVGIGYDLIPGLTACFECCKKHITAAKVLYKEWIMGYPEHSNLTYSELTKANKAIEEGMIKYWDSLGELDMASRELIGDDFKSLDSTFKVELIELANKIRAERILFQEDSTKVPNWDKLRVEVQKLQNKIAKK